MSSEETGELYDTYVAALQHGLVELPEGVRLLGVVRRPTRWFHAAVDENRPSLAPPETLLDEFSRERDDLKMAGLCDEGAHNAAWENIGFGERYREYLDADEPRAALESLAAELRAGDDAALVCYENTEKKRCHRTVLRDVLADRLRQ
ncbi:DUF488 family protein, N3 subclade [Haloprofundus halophilus]|uniref:DUF488 family protein, N3 subclade n=1 Tax=Haloprofundus halophilus TaxID=2283527 RepID=UPI000E436DC4|nr:DUF488 family protein [Haloprofundus halophilus]